MCNKAVDPTCDDPKDIADYLATNGIQFAYIVQNDNMDHFNHSNPVQPFYFFAYSYLFPTSYTSQSVYWEVATYESDNGYIFEKKKTEYAVLFDPSWRITNQVMREPLNVNIRLAFCSFGIYPYYSEKFSRSYEKLQDTIANIGGVLSVVEMIGTCLLNFIIGNM